MSKNISAIDSIRRVRFETEVGDIMKQRHPRHHALLTHFSAQSERFAQLSRAVLDHYYSEQGQLSPLAAADAMVLLVDRTMENMHQALEQAA